MSGRFTSRLIVFLMLTTSWCGAQEVEELLKREIGRRAINEAQTSISQVIAVICPSPVIDLEADLQSRCDEIAVNSIRGADDQGVSDALQGMAAEEGSATKNSKLHASSSNQSATVKARQSSARSGATSLASVNLNVDGKTVLAYGGSGEGTSVARGGAAGTGDPRLAGWGFFLEGTFATGDKDETSRESGFDFDAMDVLGGADYLVSEDALIGAALGYTGVDAEINRGGGGVDSDSLNVFAYASYYPSEAAYVDGIVNLSFGDHDQRRRIRYNIASITGPGTTVVDNTALSSTDSRTFGFSARAGYDFFRGDWVYGPLAQIEYASVRIDGFTERMASTTAAGSGLAARIDNQRYDTLPLSLGGRVVRYFPTGWGEIAPELRVAYVHEFANDADEVTGSFVGDPSAEKFSLPTDKPDRDFVTLTAGATADFGEGRSGYFEFGTVLGHELISTYAFKAGVSLRF